MTPRPDAATWAKLLKAFTSLGGNVRKVAKATGIDAATARQAWAVGWPGQAEVKPEIDLETGMQVGDHQPGMEPLLPIHDIVMRATMHARKTRERIYKKTVEAQVQFSKDATDDAMRQRALEALAVRTSLMLADQGVKNALDVQLATRPMYDALALKMAQLSEDPKASVGKMLHALREAAEIGRLATQQLETAMVLERKHLGEPESHFKMTEQKSAAELASELKMLLVNNFAARIEHVVDAVEVALPASLMPQEGEHVYEPPAGVLPEDDED